MRHWNLIGVLSFVCFALLSGCYAHTPVKSARQLEAGEVAVSGQVRMPAGLVIFPGLAGVGQVGFGAGDAGVQVGTGYTDFHAGAMFALYPYDGLTLGIDGTYAWLPLHYEGFLGGWVSRPQRRLTSGFEAVFLGEYRWGILYGGPRAQAAFWIPPASPGTLPEEAHQTHFVGMTFGGVLGAAFRLSQKVDVVVDARYLPVVFDTGVLSDDPGTYVGGAPDIVFRNYGNPLAENRIQLTAGFSLHF